MYIKLTYIYAPFFRSIYKHSYTPLVRTQAKETGQERVEQVTAGEVKWSLHQSDPVGGEETAVSRGPASSLP